MAGDRTGTGGGGFGGGWPRKHRLCLRVCQERREADRTRARATERPFAVNQVVPLLDEHAFEATLEAQPAVVSLALGDPGDLVEPAHAAGAKVIHQVHTLGQACRVAKLGVDAIIAQGSEAGGQGMPGRGCDGARSSGRRRGGPRTGSSRGRRSRREGACGRPSTGRLGSQRGHQVLGL